MPKPNDASAIDRAVGRAGPGDKLRISSVYQFLQRAEGYMVEFWKSSPLYWIDFLIESTTADQFRLLTPR